MTLMVRARGKAIAFDPTAPELVRDPYPTFHRLREVAPLAPWEGGVWLATGYDAVKTVLRSKAFGQGDFVAGIQHFYDPGFDVLGQSVYRWLSHVFIMQDPPAHTRVRGLVNKAVTARRILALEPRVRELTDGLLDRFAANHAMELIRDFAYRLPSLVMAELLGIGPDELDEAAFGSVNQAIADTFIVFEPRALTPAELALANRQMDFLFAFAGALFERRRANPRDDLLTALLEAREGDNGFTGEELASIVIAFFGAGFETTAHMIGNGLLALQRHPDQWAKLRDDPGLAQGAADEALRFESSLQATYRTALEDAVIGDARLEAGAKVLVLVAAANRDPAVFPDPDRFDLQRTGEKHISFGGGIHYCVGAELARLEGRVAFETLARRMPGLAVDVDGAQWRGGFFFRGLQRLDVTW